MPTDTMESALDAAQVFANSANAVRVFEALYDGPTASRDLAERTGAARSTVGRILDRGESRGWIDSAGSQYELTRLGETMIEEFRRYLQTLEGIQHLGEDFQYLPEPAHELEYRHFRDATIIKPTPTNPSAPFERVEKLLRSVDKFPFIIARALHPRLTKVTWELWKGDTAEGETIVDTRILESVQTDPERAEMWYEWAQTGRIWLHHAPRITIMFTDEVVLIGLADVRGDVLHTVGSLDSENPAVLSWAESLFEEYRAESEQLTPEMFSEA